MSSEAGDWKLRLRNQHGAYEELVLRNVVYMPSASHNILSTRRIKKPVSLSRSGPKKYDEWFPDSQLEHLYNTPARITSKIPFCEAGSELSFLPTLDCQSTGISAATEQMLDKLHPHSRVNQPGSNKASVHTVAETD